MFIFSVGNVLAVHRIMLELATGKAEMRKPFISEVQPKRFALYSY